MKAVLDTNIVLDLFVFRDAGVRELEAAIAGGEVTWIATPAMRDEFATVLRYEQIAAWFTPDEHSAPRALAAFDGFAVMVEAAPACPLKCRDADDQKFIDLAVAHGATLLSKDKHVLALARKLAKLDVRAAARLACAR